MLNFAVIGTGWITTSFIAGAHATNAWKLTAVYSRKEETAKHFASKHDVSTTHTTIESLCNDKNVDAVYIASPNSLHYEQAKQILAAKKHVILEKPSCSTEKELDGLFKNAKENEVFLIEAFRHLQESNFKILKSNLSKLGSIYGATLTFGQRSSRFDQVLAGETPNIFNLNYSGGALTDLGVYHISFAVALFGRPKKSIYWPYMLPTGTDGGGFGILEYEGFNVQFSQSKMWASTIPTEIYGQNGTMRVVGSGVADIEEVNLCPAKKGEEIQRLAGEKQHLNLMEEAKEFARIIENRDVETARRLERISRDVLASVCEMRKGCGIKFPADEQS